MERDEQFLLTGIKSGNELAYQQLFSTYYELLISYAVKFVGSKDDSREVVQKVFVRLFEKRDGLTIHSLKAYLTKSVYHECLEHLRKTKDHRENSELDKVENIDLLDQAEREAKIWKAIDQLPPKCHQIFVLNRFEGMKNGEIAKKLGISKRTVETQISTALKTLRKKLLALTFLIG